MRMPALLDVRDAAIRIPPLGRDVQVRGVTMGVTPLMR
jgi:hypothetical protein